MSNNEKQPQHINIKINQDEINTAGMAPRPPAAPDRPVIPFTMEYWLRHATKTICLKSNHSGSSAPKILATLG